MTIKKSYFSLEETEGSLQRKRERLLYYCGRGHNKEMYLNPLVGSVGIGLNVYKTFIEVVGWKLKVAGFVIEGCNLHPQNVGGPMIVDYIGLTDRHFSVKHEVSAQEEMLAKIRGKIGLPSKRYREEWLERALAKMFPKYEMELDPSSHHHSGKHRHHVNVGTVGHVDFSRGVSRFFPRSIVHGFDVEADMFPKMVSDLWAKYVAETHDDFSAIMTKQSWDHVDRMDVHEDVLVLPPAYAKDGGVDKVVREMHEFVMRTGLGNEPWVIPQQESSKAKGNKE